MSKVRALVLFSGGLDSMLTVKVLQNQGIETEGICFASVFFSCQKVKQAAKNIGLQFKTKDISKELLEIVKNPPSGYGKHLNPCIDCHALMIKIAREYLKIKVAKETGFLRQPASRLPQNDSGGYDFMATGEVLGQRPFSQNKETLARIERLAGVEILRPLSAKLLPETEAEKKGLVNRARLLNIRGRSRERQMELVEKYRLKGFATPAGGCLLTDPEFSQRLGKMLDYWPACRAQDVELLRYGRIFWLTLKSGNQKILLIIGRNKEDDNNLNKAALKNDVIIELKELTGPTSLLRGVPCSDHQPLSVRETAIPEKIKMSELKLGAAKSKQEIIEIASLLTGFYATKARGRKAELEIKVKN